MRAVFAGAALAAFVVTPSLADYYIIQEPTTKRCRIVEDRPASPSVGVLIGPGGFGVRAEAESRMRTVEESEKAGRLAAVSSFKSVNGFPSACANQSTGQFQRRLLGAD
jgi:hypothetical protein